MAHEKLIAEGKKALRKNIAPEEVEDYFLKKGMDKTEVKKAVNELKAERIVEENKKAAAEKRPQAVVSQNEKKSGLGLYILIFLAIAIAIFLFYYGIIPAGIFKMINFK